MQNNYFSSNLKKIAELQSQRKVAEDTNVSPASINNYISGASEPSLNFLISLKNAYNINIEDFIFRDLDIFDSKKLVNPINKRFIGNYMLYYYDSSAYKGRVSDYSKSTLNYAIISIYAGKGATENVLRVSGAFKFKREKAETIIKELNKIKSADDIASYYEQLEDKYDGEFERTNEHFFIKLRNKENNDHCFLIFNNPPSTANYIGGIGTSNSISRGREHMPCIQYIIISKQVLNIAEGEIYNLLSLGMPEVNIKNETDKIVELFKNIFVKQNEFTNSLSDYQKKRIIEDSLSSTIQDVIQANLFRFAKVSDNEDDKYYRIIKNEENYDK